MIKGDNLGASYRCGFNLAFSNGYCCRDCNITCRQMKLEKRTGQPRTPENYDAICDLLESAGGARPDEDGIRFRSPYNELAGFHVMSGSPPCIAHDCDEGAFARDLQSVFKLLVAKKSPADLSEQDINNQLSGFNYKALTTTSATKPPPTFSSKNKRLKGTANEIRLLIRICPIMLINLKVHQTMRDAFIFVLVMSELSSRLYAPRIPKNSLEELQTLIDKYFKKRNALLPAGPPITPKHHFIRDHYVANIRKFGPLTHVSSLRPESFHSVAKRASSRSHNAKNVILTISRRLLAYSSMQSLERSDETENPVADVKLHSVCLTDEEMCLVDAHPKHEDFAGMKNSALTNVNYRNIRYRKGWCLYLGNRDFGVIEKCVVGAYGCLGFVVTVRKAVPTYCAFWQCSELSSAEDTRFVVYNELCDQHPHSFYSVGNSDLLLLRHNVVDYSVGN